MAAGSRGLMYNVNKATVQRLLWTEEKAVGGKPNRKLPRSALGEGCGSGHYALNEDGDGLEDESSVLLLRGAMRASEDAKDGLISFMNSVPKTPNPMNRKTFLRRRQCTFGCAEGYRFGQQQSIGITDNFPSVIHDTLSAARSLASWMGYGDVADKYDVVHCNYYPDGESGMGIHRDDEECMVKDAPIFSFTMMPQRSRARLFAIYRDEFMPVNDVDDSGRAKKKRKASSGKPKKVAECELMDGDVLVMVGAMQKDFLHGVEKARPQRLFRDSPRINLTVRAFVR